jgi:hypothetical protein
MCGPSSGQVGIANSMKNFANTVLGQVQDVFGTDNSVVDGLMSKYATILGKGPNQNGYSWQEYSARRSNIISNNAIAARNARQATQNAVSNIGGGNTALPSGAANAATAGINTKFAENQANELNNLDIENKEVGRQQYWKAAEGEMALPRTFDNLPNFDQAAQSGMNQEMIAQKNIDSQKGWWKKPVMGLVGGALSMVAPGLPGSALSDVAAGAGQMMQDASGMQISQ